MKKNPHMGSSFDDFLKEEGIYEDALAHAHKMMLVRQLEGEMKKKRLSKAVMAKKMKTSRAQLDRLLNPDNTSLTLHTLLKAATVLGKEIHVGLVDAGA